MKLPIYPKLGEICQVKMADSRFCPLLDLESYSILDWIGNRDVFLVIKVLEYSMDSVHLDVLYKNKKGTIRIKPTNIELIK